MLGAKKGHKIAPKSTISSKRITSAVHTFFFIFSAINLGSQPKLIICMSIFFLKDSKLLSIKKRETLSKIIKRDSVFTLASVDNNEIDTINIHQASLKAMQEAIIKLPIVPDIVYVDGKFIPDVGVNCKAIVRGDKLIKEISAASIIAKVHRDEFMKKLDKKIQGLLISDHNQIITLLNELILKYTHKETINIIVDYSCMTKSWYYTIILYLKNRNINFNYINSYFCYTPSLYIKPEDPKPNTEIGPLPGKYIIPTDKPKALIVGLGYEENKAEGIIAA